MDLSTLVIEEELNAFLATAYSSLLREYIIFTIAMVISFVIFPIFAVWILNRRDRSRAGAGKPYKAYTHRHQAKVGIHITVYSLMLVLAIRALCLDAMRVESVNVYGQKMIVLHILLLLLSAAAAWKLFKWRVSGLFLTGAFVFFYTACEQYKRLLILHSNMSRSAKFTPVEEYTLYIVNDYGLTYAMAVSLSAVVIVTALAVYYYRRRFLFLPEKLDLPTCDFCGQMISPGDGFCTCCGKPLRNRVAAHVIESLDDKTYCGTCGRYMNDTFCLFCNKENKEAIKKVNRELFWEKMASGSRHVVLVICIVALMISNMIGSVTDIESGSTNSKNAFVERLLEFYNDPDQASDPEWLAGFDSAARALNVVDTRWYYVKPRSLKSNELIYFHVYANASFRQMKGIEQMQQAAHDAAEGRTLAAESRQKIENLTNYFDQTILEQTNAGKYTVLFFRQKDLLGNFGYLCLNALHTILPAVNIVWVAIAVLTVCTVMWIAMMNGFAFGAVMAWEKKILAARANTDARISKYAASYKAPAAGRTLYRAAVAVLNCWRSLLRIANEVWMLFVELAGAVVLFASLFRPRNIVRCVRWLKTGLTAPKNSRAGMSATYQRMQRKSMIIAVVIVAVYFTLFLGIAFKSGIADKLPNKPVYLVVAKAVTVDYAADITQTILDIETTGTLTDAQKEQLYTLIDLQMEADQMLLDYDISQLDDYQELHAGLCSLCKDDMEALKRLRAAIDEGFIPSKELQKNYASLRGEQYLWAIQKLTPEFVLLNVEITMDL